MIEKLAMRQSFTVGQFIYLYHAPMTTYAAGHLAKESYSKLKSAKTGPFKVIEASPTTIKMDEDGARNTVSINGDTLAPSAKYAERKLIYMPHEPGAKRDDKVHEGRGQTTTGKLADAQCEHAVDCIVCHVDEGDNVRYVVRWCGRTQADDMVELPENIPEHYVSCNWRQMKKTGAVQQRCERANSNRTRKVQK